MKVRWTPQSLRFPSLKGKLIVSTFRGQMYVRAWPRKRGPSKSAQVRRQVEWFKDANALAKKLEPTQQALAIAMTKGTGLYPRDLLLRQMSDGMYDLIDEDGINIRSGSYFRETVVFQGVILNKTATQVLPAGVSTLFTWPLPVRDTAGFWDILQPTRITIPSDIDFVRLDFGWTAVANPGATRQVINIRKNGASIARFEYSAFNLPSAALPLGPLAVVQGDYFEAFNFTSLAAVARGTGECWFTLTVLGAL